MPQWILISIFFLRGTGIFILNKTGSLQPILQRQTWKKRKLHSDPCKNPRSSLSPTIGAIHEADHHTDEGNEVWKAPWAAHQRTNAPWRRWTNRPGEMAGSHHITETRESDASDNDPGSPDNKNPEGEVNHQRRWDKQPTRFHRLVRKHTPSWPQKTDPRRTSPSPETKLKLMPSPRKRGTDINSEQATSIRSRQTLTYRNLD